MTQLLHTLLYWEKKKSDSDSVAYKNVDKYFYRYS